MTPSQSGHRNDGNEGILHIPQSSSITTASPSDCLMSHPGHSLGVSYPSADMHLVYSTAPANLADTTMSGTVYINTCVIPHIYIYIYIYIINYHYYVDNYILNSCHK